MAFNNAVNTIWLNNPASTDAFSRFRVSNPVGIFDAQMTYDLQPLLYDQVTSGTGASIVHDASNRMANLAFSSTPSGGSAYMQTFEYFRYQPGKSQLVFVTFNFLSQITDCLKFAGYSDGVNGIEFQNNGVTNQVVIYSSSSAATQVVTQANWNLDKMDGSGDSGITLDISKTQILCLDFQSLYVGRVRIGFDIDGDIIYVHEFLHANNFTYPYYATANLPVRCGMTCSGTVSTTMNFICCSVSSEGGRDKLASYTFNANTELTAANGTDTYVMSIRPKTTFNSIQNRSKFNLLNVNINVTGNSSVYIKLLLGQVITTPTYVDANTSYSAFEYDTSGTLSGSPAIILDAFFASAQRTATSLFTYSQPILRYPLTLDAAGANRDLGTLGIIAQGVGGNSAMTASITWSEER